MVATVLEIMTSALFSQHYYSFGGKFFHQRGGGPIGLRATCAVARVCMQIFDIAWKRRLELARIDTWLLSRYVDDSRAFLQPIKRGWRYDTRGLVLSQEWAEEDRNLTPTEVTKRVLAGTMKGVEEFLEFTYETCQDFDDGWLPTLDTCLRIGEGNIVEYKHYEKPMSSKRTLQMKTAMNENCKMQILSNDMVRRLLNTKDDLGATYKGAVVDNYAEKLLQSGYSREQTVRIVKNGIKGYEGKRKRRLAEGRPLRSTAALSIGSRYKKKLLAMSNWFKKRSN